METKPAMQSVTVLGSGFVVLTWALPWLLHMLGIKDSQDVSDIVAIVHQAGPLVGAAVAVYGRMRARTQITGIVRAPEQPPY